MAQKVCATIPSKSYPFCAEKNIDDPRCMCYASGILQATGIKTRGTGTTSPRDTLQGIIMAI